MKISLLLLFLMTGCAGWGRNDNGAAVRDAEVQFHSSMERLRGEYGTARGVRDAK